MSNLIKPYEISVWDDIWDSDKGKFVEKKLLVIGTDEMASLNRALEPVLTRNVNGTKKFSFKMYKRYIDRETGEEVHNLFIDYLINERKIKLKYGVDDEGNAKWYDFIIKNVNETSTTYLYQFDLEDAIVQELSKNGFGVTLDAQLNNNIGTADQLAMQVLADTDWTVSGSDKLVQEVKEHLVYVSAPTTLEAWALKNSGVNYDLAGVIEEPIILDTTGKTILAFYSSCTGKPHRFQFIILPDYIETNEDNVIINKDCQYFIECNPDDYTVKNTNYGFVLPAGWSVQDQGAATTEDKDTTVSHKYRGNRFGYAQQAVYLPKLDRYVNKYTHDTYGNIYGYVDNEYISPVLMTNLISNTEFKNTSGWKGIAYGVPTSEGDKPKSEEKAKVENVYGSKSDTFVSAMEDLSTGSLKDASNYEAYMKLTFPKSYNGKGYKPAIINNGPFDNRTLIGNIVEGDEWALYVEGRTINDLTNLNFALEESEYVSNSGCYEPVSQSNKKVTLNKTVITDVENGWKAWSFTFTGSDYQEKTFKKQMKLRLVITYEGEIADESEHYIKTIELHKVVRDKDNKIIRLKAQANKIDEGVVNTKYFYFTKEAYDAATIKDEIKYIHTADKAEPSAYEPVYNARAEKIRSVTAKESNYFNILQSIAETFEAWLDLKIIRDDNGTVTDKQVSFKKYSGGDNYAAFRYGVNLKDITRTTESKQIVTKLIVKNNSNELAPNKFCTIQKAPSNVSGENYIYDFQYYHNNGLLDADDYLNELYYTAGASGLDIEYQRYKEDPSYKIEYNTDTNIKGYFPRLKALNNQLVEINEQMSGLSQELLQLKAEREVAEATYEAAESGIEQISEDFETLTGFSITDYVIEGISNYSGLEKITEWSEEKADKNAKHYLVSEDLANSTIYTLKEFKLDTKTFTYTFKLSRNTTELTSKTINATLYTSIQVNSKWLYQPTSIKFKFKSKTEDEEGYTSTAVGGVIKAVDIERSDVNKLLTEYLTYQQEKNDSGKEKDRLTELIDGTIILDGDGRPVLDEKDEPKRNNDGKQYTYNALKQQFEDIRDNQKLLLNKAFFQKYSRFIQEGTWIDEQYVDDEKYYNDAQTVLYNSCYPKVGYTINVLSLSKMPGYELFVFDVGEKTYAEDEEFFGTDANGYPNRTEIVITEMSEHLDNPSADSIKVQNFKNQFQDLFQKITATVQQTQYNEGTYRKGAALIEASNAKKNEFLLDSLSDPASVLSNAGQNEVVWDNAGITVTNTNNRSEQLRLVSSGIMFSTDSEGGPKWSTGITPQGISANKILAGSINTGEISLMNGKDASFLWNAFGINAFDYTIENGSIVGVNKNKFVRFDRNGIYGINGLANADTWTPEDLNEVEDKATFALTWEGLKVTGSDGVVARIGNTGDNIIDVTNSMGTSIFKVTKAGEGQIGKWYIGTNGIFSSTAANSTSEIFLSPSGVIASGSTTRIVFKAGSNFRVNNTGAMYASAGKIAEFNITNSSSTYGARLYASGLEWQGSGTAKDHGYEEGTKGSVGMSPAFGLAYAFWAGGIAENGGDSPFRVAHNGSLYASNATIEGRITATDGEIGGWTIVSKTSGSNFNNLHHNVYNENGSVIQGTGLQAPNSGTWAFAINYSDYDAWRTAKFKVDHNGNLYIGEGGNDGTNTPFKVQNDGYMKATYGEIGGWKLDSNSLYNGSSNNWYDKIDISPTGIHFQNTYFGNEYLYFQKYGKDDLARPGFYAGEEFYKSYKYFSIYVDGAPGGDSTRTNTYLGIPDLTKKKEWFPTTSQILYPKTVSGAHINFFAYNKVADWGNNYASFNGTWIAPASAAMYATSGDWGTGSDKRIKTSILEFSNKQTILFDGLKPRSFEYLDGTSHRKHYGFIAQEVVEAMATADLSTQDFAGVMLYKPGQENECWYLRYTEFIALNTDQIQKLKPRVSTLEQTILNYESRISNLETEIQNLKSSQNSDII